MTSQPGKQTIAINILPNFLRNKDNQTMKFGQLTEYGIRKIFVEKSYPKCGRETSSKPFSEKVKLSISLDKYFKVLYSLFSLKLSCRPLAFTSYKAFLTNKKRSRTSLPASFSG